MKPLKWGWKRWPIAKCISMGHSIRNGKLQKTCRTCDRYRSRLRYRKSRKYRRYHREYMKNMYLKGKAFVYELKKGKKCLDCNRRYPPWILQFDHRDHRLKKFTIGKHGRQTNEDNILKESKKCDLVCANCHAERTHKRLPQLIHEFRKNNTYYAKSLRG